MLNKIEQLSREVSAAKRILVVTPGTSTDALTSTAALLATFEKLGKVAEGVSLSEIPSNLSFLPFMQKVQNKSWFGNDFVISFDISKMGVESLSYKVDGSKLNIFITPKTAGEFGDKDVTLKKAKIGYDLIITINSQDLTKLGEIFNKNPELFYNATIVNIDHDPANESFGKINLIDIHAASTTQILNGVIKELAAGQENFIDKDISTLLLAGIIAETESFQTYSVTPEVMKTASELFEKGANQQEIVRHLFRTKELETLNLWGQILANLKQDEAKNMAWSVISKEDFIKSQTTPQDIEGALKELLSSIPSLQVAFVLYPQDNNVHGKIFAPHNIDALGFASLFPYAHGDAHLADFMLPETSLGDAETQVLSEIRKKITLPS